MICKSLLDRPNNTQAWLLKFIKNARNEKFYDIEDEKNPLTKKFTQRKSKLSKRYQHIKQNQNQHKFNNMLKM